MNLRTISEINERILDGEATVLTAGELKELVINDEAPSADEVDVVTAATCGVMSGTAAVMHFRVSEPGSFRKAVSAELNGIPAYPGPCPNENLGSVDLFIYGTAHSSTDPDYGGGFLLRDLLLGSEVHVKVTSEDGSVVESTVTLNDIETARIIGTRMAFRNYTAIVNPSDKPAKSIFNAFEMPPHCGGLSFSGCGDINPLENDPGMEFIRRGTSVLLNGARGLVLGEGTRSSPEKPNLMLSGDLHDMNPAYIGGFRTAAGPEIFNTIAVPLPVTSERVFERLMVLNSDIRIPVADVRDRSRVIHDLTYADTWAGDERPAYNPEFCSDCSSCLAAERCPTHAIDNGVDLYKCFGCGVCAFSCPYGVYEMDTGEVRIGDRAVPIICRQSDRVRASRLALELKELIENGDFLIGGC
ncbi:methanogenesis marker 16 metalloprotein [Methanothermobacter sp. K4]|uniref:methanogenesis marker 16 metalloprotein n=1 Tax=Methanothermobacter sp. K4 TaxID=2913262 RepID=UPI001EDBBAF8|nr:methanogenesis marker 16 metalloprotein [Methanothermobacter sp. K4]MCG2827655.1 methanogenesis marker 16 metalloprotein [Methanothermobacter sp. K4]